MSTKKSALRHKKNSPIARAIVIAKLKLIA
jgi:hypothetical protein